MNFMASVREVRASFSIVSEAVLKAIGAVPSAVDLGSVPREQLPDACARAAETDPDFTALIARGVASIKSRRWKGASDAIVQGLARYPYHAGSWQQLACIRAGEGAFGAAEIAWRTAAAYGAAAGDVQLGLATALREQGLAEDSWPLHMRTDGPASLQAPGLPDVELLARLAWQADSVSQDDCLKLLRTCASLDATLAAMIADPRFARVNLVWLDTMRSKGGAR